MSNIKNKHKITLGGKVFDYIFRKSKLSKNLKLAVRSDAGIYVSAPTFLSQKKAEGFMQEKAAWLIERINYFSKINETKVLKTGSSDYIKKKNQARKLVLMKLEKFNAHYNFKYKRIAIRNQRTRWGSCSAAGNLNFNYRLIYLPEHLIDYIIVHELCHLRQMNHSIKFWTLVAEMAPGFKQARRDLKKQGINLF